MGIIGITEAGLVLSDNTTANASTTKHGLAPKYPNDATKYLDGTGAYSVPAGGGGTGLTAVSVQSGAYTAAASALVPVDANAASGNFAVSLPASPSNGDRVGVLMVAEHATRKVTVSLNGGSFAGTIGYFDLILNGDFVIFQYNSTLAKWFVEQDKIQRHVVNIYRSTNQTISNATWTKVAFDAENYDIGGIGDYSTNDRVDIRRAGKYTVKGYCYMEQATVYAYTHFSGWKLNGTFISFGGMAVSVGTGSITFSMIPFTHTRELAVADYIELFVFQNSNAGYSQDFNPLHLFVEEIKP